MKQNWKRLFLVWGVLALVLMACSSPTAVDESAEPQQAVEAESDGGETAVQPEVRTLVFATNGWERGRFDMLVDRFEEENPDIRIELISIEEIVGQQGLYSQDGSGSGMLTVVQSADVIGTYFDQNLLQDGMLLNMDPLLDASDEVSRDDFFPAMLDMYRWNGGMWGMPTAASFSVMFYNKDMFDAAGVEYPQPGWTWDDMLSMAQALTVRNGGEVEQWGAALSQSGMAPLVEAYGGPVVDTSVRPPAPGFDRPAVQEAVQWILDFYQVHEVAPIESWDPETGMMMINGVEDERGVFGLIEDGRVAMWPEHAEAWQYRSGQGNYGMVPMPVSDVNPNSSPMSGYGPSALGISAGTTKPEAAWRWVLFLTHELAQSVPAYQQGNRPITLPPLRATFENGELWQDMDPMVRETLVYAADHAFSPQYNDVYGMLDGAVRDAVAGNERKTAAEVLDEAEVKIEEMRSTAEATPGPTAVPEFTVAEPEQPAEGTVEIEFVVGGGDPSLYREVARTYNEETEGVRVRILEPNYFEGGQNVRSVIGDAACFQWYTPLSGSDLENVLSVQPLLDADPDISSEDFFPGVLDMYTEQGQLQGLPMDVQIRLLSYNKELFDAAGVDYPLPGWTLDDFLAAAVAITTDEGEDTKVYGFVPNPYELGDMLGFAERQGAELIDNSVDPPTTQFASDEMIAAVQWYVDLNQEYGVKPYFEQPEVYTPETDPYQRAISLIQNDRAGIWPADLTGGTYGPPNMQQDGQEMPDIGYVPYPRGTGGGATFAGGSGFYISADTEYRQECWEWIKYAGQQPGLFSYSTPARVAVVQSDAYRQQVGIDRAAVVMSALENSDRPSNLFQFSPGNNWIGSTFYWLDQAYMRIAAGDMTVAEGMGDAQTKAESFRACVIETEAFETFPEQEECLKQADPNWGQGLRGGGGGGGGGG